MVTPVRLGVILGYLASCKTDPQQRGLPPILHVADRMPHRVAVVLCAKLLFLLQSGSANAETPPPVHREFRAAWIATVDNIDWPSKPGLPPTEQRQELIALLDLVADLRMNAVVFQVRPACDALYASELEPWSEYLTGTAGKAPEDGYDPLEFAVTEAHRRGIELHAWFNPYRALHPSSKSPAPSNHISKTQPELVKQYGNYLWLDPGEPKAAEHSRQVILDVVRRYDIDAVHFDDYFYPYPVVDDNKAEIPFPDDASWRKYIARTPRKERRSRRFSPRQRQSFASHASDRH